ncbi:ABC transporter ATP-binding protein [Microlunatus soli]|uniref:Peptide/nickel transport system ATP-binding protein n=1 Tax=Microlunatus soli TaxID=630515 RepID=A0A1H1WY78_9ACTN|nr:ABC transporter ATP-binding protein [Microlunatus soli]SDT01326.1 peptide/nickel transport system ATP-binding protein [Microlunatus soli]
MSLLQVRNLTQYYPNSTAPLPALDDVSLEVAKDSVVAVVGESGCGKTTLGRIASGLLKPTEGEVIFDDQQVWKLPRSAWNGYRRRVQIIQQDPYASLNPGLTLMESLRPGLLRHKIVPRRQVTEEALRLLALVGLDDDEAFLRRFPHQLSGGQRQRFAIARAVSLRPDLIVADEPTSMLDVSVRVAILDLLLALQAEEGLAYVFISHDFGVVRYFTRGGRIVVMFFGQVVEEGPAEQIIGRPRHPYSFQLLEAIPVPDPRTVRARARQIDEADLEDRVDQPPSLTGCIFANRCPFADDACRSTRPPLIEVAPGHRAACLYPERVPDLPDAVRTVVEPGAADVEIDEGLATAHNR